MITYRTATTAADIAAVVALCWAYRAELMETSPVEHDITQTFYPEPKYARLMDALAQEHAAPRGLILLGLDNGTPVACGMSHPLGDASEIKRVFVTSERRGKGIAETLCRRLIDHARSQGFARAVLDTSVGLDGAQRLYDRLGFTRRGPYQDIPASMLPHLVFFEKHL